MTSIDVVARRPSFSGAFGTWRRAARSVGLHHATTTDEVVKRFLALQVGEPCSDLRRAESERILRAQPFLAQARVRTYSDGAGGVRVEAETVDEVPAIVGFSFAKGVRPGLIKLGNGNVAGRAVLAEASWRDGGPLRDGARVHITDYQALGRPYTLDVVGDRAPLGGQALLALTHPYYSDLQRIAWRAVYSGEREYTPFVRADGMPAPAVGTRRDYADVGGVMRFGPVGRLALIGGSVSRDDASPDGSAVLVTDSGLTRPAVAELTDRYPGIQATRLNALLGLRDVRFLEVKRFNSLDADEDVRVGGQLGTVIGRSLNRPDGAHDTFVAGDLYIGGGSPQSFVAVQGSGEARRPDRGSWDGMLAGGRAAWYLRTAERHTLVTTLDLAGGWRQRVPFQLTLRDPVGGIRGYARSPLGGARRSVLRVEERWSTGQFRKLADVGFAAFTDAGRVRAGDVPFGVNSSVHASVGIGMLAAVPVHSQRLWRLDVAAPLVKQYGEKGRLIFRISTGDRTGMFYNQPNDLARSRTPTVPTSVFAWP